MDSSWIASTPNQGLRPVSAPGQRDHGVLVQLLTQHLSEDHAALFAEPVPNPDGRTTDWYAPRAGEAQPLEALDPAARAAAERRLAELYDDIRNLAARLAQSREPDAANKAALLQAALEIPDPSFIRVVDGHPVLLAWAHLKDSPDAPKAVLGSWIRLRQPTAPVPGPAAAPAEPLVPAAVGPGNTTIVPVVVEHAVWPVGLLWLLFALLALAIAWLMLSACGLGWPGGLGPAWLARCPLPVAIAGDDGLARELERQRQLEQEIAQLQRDLARQGAQCLPEPPPTRAEAPPPPPPPEPIQQAEAPPPPPPPECEASEIDLRRQEAGGQTGEVTVSLGWDGLSDLDLAILCPNGNVIRYNNTNACGGALDVDMNAGARSSSEPIENVYWQSKPRNGIYKVYVTLFDRRSDRRREIPFRVELDVLGDRRQVDGAARRYRQAELVTQFEITDEPPPASDGCPPAAAPTGVQ
jgi:hypothetical protein